MNHQEYVTTEDFLTFQRELEESRKQDHKEIMNLLTPIAKTYDAAGLMGKWIMAALVFLSVSIGVALGFGKIFVAFFQR